MIVCEKEFNENVFVVVEEVMKVVGDEVVFVEVVIVFEG